MNAIEDYALKNNISYIRLNSNVRRTSSMKVLAMSVIKPKND